MDITLIFNTDEFSYKCIDTKEKVKDIFLKFKKEIDFSSIIFLYSGIQIDGNLSIGKIINRVDNERKKMTILIQDNKEESNSFIITSKDIICPNCKECAKFDIKNYKIFLQCVKGHNVGDISLNQFEKSQKIDLSKIICDKCKKNNKAESYKNIFIYVINAIILYALNAKIFTKVKIRNITSFPMMKKIINVEYIMKNMFHSVKIAKKIFAYFARKSIRNIL